MEIVSATEKLLFSTVLLETEFSLGTAFVFNYSKDPRGDKSLFLVTNKHMIQGANRCHFAFTKRKGDKLLLGKPFSFDIDQPSRLWFGHPDPKIDITVMPLGPVFNKVKGLKLELFTFVIDDSLIPAEDIMRSFDALEEVFFIGYPNGIQDAVNLIPVIRTGTTATPLQLDYQGESKFLIDASIFPGSSGSPVFVYYRGGRPGKDGGLTFGGKNLFFVGVVSEVCIMTDEGKIKYKEIPSGQTLSFKIPQMLDLGVVYKSTTVVEAAKYCLAKI